MPSCQRHNYLLLIFSLVLRLANSLLAEERPTPVSYHLNVTIDPTLGSLAVRGNIEAPLQGPLAGEIQFALHETFAIKHLSVNDQPARFSFEATKPTLTNPATRNVVIRLPADVRQGKIHIDLEYEGRLKNLPEFGTFPDQKQALDDQINPHLVELANYSSWYPQFFVMGHPIAIDLQVSLPQGWIAICSGKKLEDEIKGGRAITQWYSPHDTDILIAASPNYKQKSTRLSEAAIEIYYTQMPEAFVDKEMGQIANVMKLFTDYLGQTTIPAGTIKHVYSPKRKGQGRAGIARPGMIVTSEGLTLESLKKDPNFSFFQDIAHEIAHFWWNFGAGQGDWINEAFAEYFSAVAVEKILSEQEFESVLENYRREVRQLPASAPSLSTVPFNGSGFVIRYYKGSLMLNHLRQALGDEKFFQAAREFFQIYTGTTIGTAEFRGFWKQRLGNQKDSLDVWLDSPGGLPELAAGGR
ncbi:MAG TPA: M1 family aminopeptidase [Terriglobales bacterium]|nr:M1 family aminopeptidase [Terriglobales bacterium]